MKKELKNFFSKSNLGKPKIVNETWSSDEDHEIWIENEGDLMTARITIFSSPVADLSYDFVQCLKPSKWPNCADLWQTVSTLVNCPSKYEISKSYL